MTTPKHTRIHLGTFDLVKGLAILLLVYGHTQNHYQVQAQSVLTPLFLLLRPLKAGLNPLFFLISGFAFKEKPVKKVLKKTFSELIKPYLWVTGIVAVLFPTIHYLSFHWLPGALEEGIRVALPFLFGIPKGGKVLFGYTVYECSVAWFLLAMFWGLNLTNLLLKVKSLWAQVGCAAAAVVAGFVLLRFDFNYFCIPQGLLATGYCYAGYLAKKHDLLSRKKLLPWLYVALCLVTAAQAIFGEINLPYGIFKLGLLDYVASLCAGVLFLLLGILAGNIQWAGLGWLRKIGIYTYWIMCIHSVELACLPWYLLGSALPQSQGLAMLIELAGKAVILSLGCIVLQRIYKNRYRRKLSRDRT